MSMHFRDSMIPLSLGIFGAIVSFAISKPEFLYALLLVPLASLVLGWVYVAHDVKVTQIGTYMRLDLAGRIGQTLGAPNEKSILGWEVKHRIDVNRAIRKKTQLIVDLIAFVVPGLFSCSLFYYLSSILSWYYTVLIITIVIPCSLYIGWAIWKFRDLSTEDMMREASERDANPALQRVQ